MSKDTTSVDTSKKKIKLKAVKSCTKSPAFFTLSGINVVKIISQYGIGTLDEIPSIPAQPHHPNTTQIDTLIPTSIIFTDESKRQHTCDISMIDYISQRKIKKENFNGYHCYWCRHSFESEPIGIPVNYIPKQVTKTYTSEISKDTYNIKGYVTDKQQMAEELHTISEEQYETNGVVCSWNCMMAFIAAHKNDPTYTRSKQLMYKMYKDCTGKELNLKPAADWRQLTVYGGRLGIIEYRNNFDKIHYDYHGEIRYPLNIRSTGHLWEEKFTLKFT